MGEIYLSKHALAPSQRSGTKFENTSLSAQCDYRRYRKHLAYDKAVCTNKYCILKISQLPNK